MMGFRGGWGKTRTSELWFMDDKDIAKNTFITVCTKGDGISWDRVARALSGVLRGQIPRNVQLYKKPRAAP